MTKALPASVNTTWRFDRVNSRVFRCPSSAEILRLTVANGTRSFRDAAERLPASTTMRKNDIASSRSISAFQKAEWGLSIWHLSAQDGIRLASSRRDQLVRGDNMLTRLLVTAFAALIISGPSRGENASELVGTWTLVSSIMEKDGRRLINSARARMGR